MNVQRCPECGQRLHTNYCDICMRKVPFGGVKLGNRQDPWESRDGSSAHRQEKGHECVSFDYEKKPKKMGKVTFTKPPRKAAAPNKKGASVIAIVIAVLSLLPSLFGLFEEAVDSVAVPEPEINIHDGFVEAGNLGAEGVPNVIAGEIYNANGIRITADTAGLSYGDYTIYFTINNDTEQKVSVSMEAVSVNGYMLPFGLYQDLKAGRSEQTSLTFYDYELEKTGIQQVANVEFLLYVYETDSYNEIIDGQLVTVETEYDGSAEPAADTSGLELYNDGSFRVILRDVYMSGSDDCEMDLYLENLSGNSVNVYCEQIWVNGTELATYYWNTLRANTRSVDALYIYDYEWEDLDISQLEQINEITMVLYIEYQDGWDILESHSEKITFAPNAIA